MKKRMLALLLALIMTLSVLSVTAGAAGKTSLFADVTTADWFYDAVDYVNSNDLMTGTDKGFAPNDATTRAQIWAILARLSGEHYDRNTTDWYASYQLWAIRNSISDGSDPNGKITRQQLAAMLYRYATRMGIVSSGLWADLTVFPDCASVSAYALEAMQWAVGSGLMQGMDGKLSPQGTATRGQVATILQRLCQTWALLPQNDLSGVLTALQTTHQSHTHDYTYTDNNDGTHTATCFCGETKTSAHSIAWDGKTCICGYTVEPWSGTSAPETELTLRIENDGWVYDEERDTKGDVIRIYTAEELAAYAKHVNEGHSAVTDKVLLMNDINLGGIDWTPIGTTEHPFRARIFDGQGHTIYNLCCNGGAKNPKDLTAVNQGLFGVTFTNGNVIEIMNLNLHNADVYAKNSAGALIGCLDTEMSSYWKAGYTGVHHINRTGKVTIEGGNSGGLAGSPVGHWALQTGFKFITIDADEGSYLSNITAREKSGSGVGGALGGVVAVAAWDRGSNDITSNLDVVGAAGNVGGIVGIGNQYWENISCTCDVTVKGVTPTASGKYNYGLAIGGFVSVWDHSDMTAARRASISATGTLRLEMKDDGGVLFTNGQNTNAIGEFIW